MAAINYKGEPVRSDAKWYFDRCSGEADIFDGIFLRCVKGSMFAGVQQLRKKNSLLKGLLDLSMKRIMLSEWDCLQILLYNVLFVRLISIVLFVRLHSTPNRNLLLQITVFSIIETFH